MKNFAPRVLQILMISALSVVLFYCSSPEGDVVPANPEAAEINDFFSSLPDWVNDEATAASEMVIDDEFIIYENNTPYRGKLVQNNLVRHMENIIAVGTNSGKIWPGAMLQGNSVESGDLQLINADRSPITLSTNLPISKSSEVIESPNSVNVQQAVTDFMIDAGDLEEGSQAGAGVMHFELEEASTFEQSMLAIGIGAGFTDPQSDVGIEGSVNMAHDRSVREHTVVAKFVQEKFTVRIADDLLPDAADFFSTSTTADDLNEMKNKGTITNENVPLYIESVTYGRILIFSTKSTEVQDASKLMEALRVSMDDYVNGNQNLSDSQQMVLNNSTTTIYSAGGTEEGANKVINGLRWEEFFVPAPVSTTVPVSFKLRSLKERKLVKLTGNVIYDRRIDMESPSAYRLIITLNKAELNSGFCVNCRYSSWVKEDNAWINSPIAAGNVVLFWTATEIGGTHTISNSGVGSQFEVQSQYCTGAYGFVCSTQNYLNKATTTYRWPYENLKSGNTALLHVVDVGLLSSIRFEYNIRKEPIW